MKNCIKIKFTDFWPGFDKENNMFVHFLQNYYQVEFSDDPDIVIYSCYGFDFLKYTCSKIFYTAENVRPDFRECDYAFTFDYPDYSNRNFRLPLYRWRGDLDKLIQVKDAEKIVAEKTKFCCMLVSNPNGKERNLFFEKLSKYKQVDSGGKHLNNIGYRVPDKNAFIAQYKFTLSFENTSYPGYTTEKLVEPMLENSLPVYWGNTLVGNDFNTKSFINIHDFASFDEAIERIIAIDSNDDLYIQYLNQPYFKNNVFPHELEFKTIEDKFIEVVNTLLHNKSVTNGFNRWYSVGKMIKKKLISKVTKEPLWYC
ncbi:glycosyltransferase family 10 [Ferruginibacter lapsinanis]|uniref:glycosyltransferase family 10 domain-containing protein n=1 Tax=Ferruginibacter lapsinanis TaxID=563172 RepID=UPI001E2C64C6|nr:glycosyltransferase family 10 [Ferruginibacter lapsinanis]UEG49458.1 glycosyltransferase family 10 [Ferruginibacter lapsinanis]